MPLVNYYTYIFLPPTPIIGVGGKNILPVTYYHSSRLMVHTRLHHFSLCYLEYTTSCGLAVLFFIILTIEEDHHGSAECCHEGATVE